MIIGIMFRDHVIAAPARVLALTLSSAVLVAGLSSSALAGTFTRPARLPTSEGWTFALNDSGTAVATNGSRVYEVGRRGHLIHSWPLRVPGGYEPEVGSLVLDDRGRIAAGLRYDDHSESGSEYNPGCCAHAAVATWILGEAPAIAQELVASGAQAQYGNDSIGAPQVAIGTTSVTALWSAGGSGSTLAPAGESNLNEAFGPFGSTLDTQRLLTVREGIQAVHLGLDAAGKPVAAWRADGVQIEAARGDSAGAITQLSRPVTLPPDEPKNVIPEDGDLAEGNEFVTDSRGDTLFAYTGGFSHSLPVLTLLSVDGGTFRPVTDIGRAPSNHEPPFPAPGPGGSVLVLWRCLSCTYLEGRVGSIRGPLTPFRVPTENDLGTDTAFIAGPGHIVAIYPGNDGRLLARMIIDGRPLGQPRPVSPPGCGELGSGGDDEPPITTNQHGEAIFWCSSGGENAYLMRYRP
jgi:hypothetical protein